MILLIGGEKGGTGKTTVAVNLAAMRSLHGRDVLLVDTDPQGSSSYWAQVRDEAGINPRVASIQKFGKGVQQELQDLARRYQDIVIDAGGRDSVELRAALVVANLAVIPIQASQFDLWTLDRMNGLVEQAKGFNEKLRATVLITRGPTNPTMNDTKEAAELIADFASVTLAKAVVRDRVSYRRSASGGMGVVEYQPADPKASAEMEALYAEVYA